MATAAIGEVEHGGLSRLAAVCAAAVAGAVATVGTAWACAHSPIFRDPTGAALWRSAFVASYVGVGVYSYWRRPESRLGPLVAAVGFLYSLASLNASGASLAYTIGMVVWVAVIVYLAYVYLCFPRGRLESPMERAFIVGLVGSTAVVWGLILVLSPTLPPGGSFTDCGTNCPHNALQIAHGGTEIALALNTAFNVLTTISLIGIAMLIFNKARGSAYLARRAMTPLTLAFIANIVEFVVFLFVGPAYPNTKDAFKIADGVVTLAVPFAMLAGQLRGHASAARSLRELWFRANQHPPTPRRVQDVVRRALGDPRLAIAVWDPDDATYVDVNGQPVDQNGGELGVTRILRNGWPVALLIHDPVVPTDSDIVTGLAETSLMLLENWRLTEELRASRSRLIQAAETERRRIERDLHDGAQQSLVAIQLKVAMAHSANNREELERQLNAIQREAEAAVNEVRHLAHGIYPPELHDFGLAVALQSLAVAAAIPVRLINEGSGRYPDAIETALYFCTREAIQNAMKHAGAGARVILTLVGDQGGINLTIEDDGVGTEPDHATTGIGIVEMRDRIEAVGGDFSIVSAPGHGMSIHASIPAIQGS